MQFIINKKFQSDSFVTRGELMCYRDSVVKEGGTNSLEEKLRAEDKGVIKSQTRKSLMHAK